MTVPAPTPDVICATCNDPGGGSSPPADLHVIYVRSDPTTRTITSQANNGWVTVMDFNTGLMTLTHDGQTSSKPLSSVFSAMANGDSAQADQMYAEMLDVVDSGSSAAVLGDPSQSGAPILGEGGHWSNMKQGGGPSSGPYMCAIWDYACDYDPWSWWDDVWGSMGYWWRTSGPGSGLPNPDACAPNDVNCLLWNGNQQTACDQFWWDVGSTGLATAVGAGACAETVGLACYAAFGAVNYTAARGVWNYNTCHTPYPY